MTTGTHTLKDLITNQDLARQTLLQYDADRLLATIERDVNLFNALVNEAVAAYAETTTSVSERSGADSGTEDTELDETGRARTQKSEGGYDVQFPLRTYGYAIGWDAKFLKRATVADLARQTLAAQKAYRARVIKQLKTALFNPVNYSVRDFAETRTMLNVKALANNDGTDYGLDTNANPVATTHSHYLAAATLTPAAVQSLVNTVLEHESGQVIIEISALDAGTWQALTGFVAAQDPVIIQGSGVTTTSLTLDVTRTDNRVIGRIAGATVYTKSWIPQGYAVARLVNGAKPLAFRQSKLEAEQGMYLAGRNSAYPLEADQWEWALGFGARNRTAAAILYFGGSVYVTPTF